MSSSNHAIKFWKGEGWRCGCGSDVPTYYPNCFRCGSLPPMSIQEKEVIMMEAREFTEDELNKLSVMFGGIAEQNKDYGVCIKVDGRIVKWLTFQAALEATQVEK